MNGVIHMRYLLVSLCAIGLCSNAQSALAQTEVAIGTIANDQLVITTLEPNALAGGLLQPLVFGQPPIPGLIVRARRPVLCSAVGLQGGSPLKKVVFDLNGYFEPVPLAVAATEMKAGPMVYGQEAFLRASEPIRFGTFGYAIDQSGPIVDLAGVQGYCILAPENDTPPVSESCAVVENEDAIFNDGHQIQPQGTLQLSASSTHTGVNLDYQYVLRASGGPVYRVNLREQFPYFLIGSGAQPTFGRSLALEQNWHCGASSGASCDTRGRSIDGAGYVHLEEARIPAGGCLKITASRFLRSDGIEAQHPFSGRLYSAAVYSKAPTANGPSERADVSVRQPFAE